MEIFELRQCKKIAIKTYRNHNKPNKIIREFLYEMIIANLIIL